MIKLLAAGMMVSTPLVEHYLRERKIQMESQPGLLCLEFDPLASPHPHASEFDETSAQRPTAFLHSGVAIRSAIVEPGLQPSHRIIVFDGTKFSIGPT